MRKETPRKYFVTYEFLLDVPEWVLDELEVVFADDMNLVSLVAPNTDRAEDVLLMAAQREFFHKGRCDSVLYYKGADGHTVKLQCAAAKGHFPERLHVAFSPSKIRVSWTNDDSNESKLIRCEKRSTPLIGWRTWLKDGDVLVSTSAKYEWTGPRGSTIQGEALDFEKEHHGVYSFKDPELLVARFQSPWIIGKLDLTGHVVEHEFGYRAQFVMIRHLWVFQQGIFEAYKEGFERRYECPVEYVPETKIEAWANFMKKEYEE